MYCSPARPSKLEVCEVTDGLILRPREGHYEFARRDGASPVSTDEGWKVFPRIYLVIARDATAPENELFMMKKELGTRVRLPVLASTV
jgi:hypothetical protein